MHRAPRGIGHTNRLASLLLETPSGGNDYVGGLELFVGFFIITPFVIWILMIFTFKLKHSCASRTKGNESKTTNSQLPTPKTLTSSDDPNAETPLPQPKTQTTKKYIPATSWIAGGDIIDMVKLSRAGVTRKQRRRLVMRSWRIQSTFLSVSILIPVLSVVLLECGWKPLELAMREIQELNDDVENLAYRGQDAIGRLELSKQELFADNELVRSILEYNYASSTEPDQKPSRDNGDRRSRAGYKEFINHNQNRRAQFYEVEQATNPPTLPITSDFDSFLVPWTDLSTSSPIKELDENHNDSDQNSGEGNIVEDPFISLDGFFNTSSSPFPAGGIFIEDWCPDAIRFIGTEELNYWVDSVNNLTEKTKTIREIFGSLEGSFLPMESSSNLLLGDIRPLEHSSSAFGFVTDTTSYVDESIEWFLANDWLLKLLVMVLNVINGLLLANVYFFSKNNVIHQPTRLYVAYILIPVFVIAAVSIVTVTVAAAIAVLVNSDFCSGGSGVGGPQGTIEEVILTLQEQQQLDGVPPNEALGLVYDAVDYYWTVRKSPLKHSVLYHCQFD